MDELFKDFTYTLEISYEQCEGIEYEISYPISRQLFLVVFYLYVNYRCCFIKNNEDEDGKDKKENEEDESKEEYSLQISFQEEEVCPEYSIEFIINKQLFLIGLILYYKCF